MMRRNLIILFSILAVVVFAGAFSINDSSAAAVVPVNLTVTPGDPCVAPLQPTLSWDISPATLELENYAWSPNIGWIKFKGTAQNGSVYGVSIDGVSGNFSGYAWSKIAGWISFNAGDLSGCPSGPCEARLNISNNQVSGWARAIGYGGSGGWIHLAGTAQNGSTYGIFKNGNNLEGWAWGSDKIGWIHFKGTTYGVTVAAATQTAYQIQVDSQSNFPFPTLIDTGKVTSTSKTYTVPVGVLNFGTTYYWRVKLWDSSNAESSWINGPSFATISHKYPTVNFKWTPSGPSAGETVQLTDQSAAYGGTSISNWLWTFQDAICKVPAIGCAGVQNPKVAFTTEGPKNVSLKVTDSDGFSCMLNKTVQSKPPLPEYKETAPAE